MHIIAVRKAEEKKMLMQRMEEYKKKKCKTGQHEKMAIFNESNPESYRSIYGLLFSEFGEEITTKIHKAYAGRQISFPKKLYTENYIMHYVKEHMWDMTGSELAKELGYTERRISQLIKSITDRQENS